MDADRFDHLSRSFAQRVSRRRAFQGLAGGGLLAAFGLSRTQTFAQETQTCMLDLTAGVRIGPTFDSRPNNDGPFEFRGQLRFGIGEQGRLIDGKFQFGIEEYDAVGQVAGPAVTIRVEFAPDQTLVLVGAGENSLRSCNGAVDGILTGPAVGDLGDWHAIATQTGSQAPSQQSTEAPGPAPTPAAAIATATDAPAQAPTDSPTQASTEAPTEAATEAPTEAPSIPSVQATYTFCLDTGIPCGSPTQCCSGSCLDDPSGLLTICA